MRFVPFARLCALLIPLGSTSTLAAQERSLRWPAIEVTAHLDADGRLALRERQTMLLSGDWNGPERRFAVPFGQSLALRGITRVDPATSQRYPLRAGELDAVDEFRWFDNYTLRWRSRLPSDPPHAATTLVYELELDYDNILQPHPDSANTYILDHNFAFADRFENIDRFTLTLTLDPVWDAPSGFTGQYEGGPLLPGENFTITIPLRHTGAVRPAGVVHGADPIYRSAAALLLVVVGGVLVLRFLAHERRLGRFAPGPQDRERSAEWLQHHVLRHPPEVIGTAWDDSTAAPEVAATLARLIAEKKLSSEVQEKRVWKFRRQVLHLQLLVPRTALSEHDRLLINALFDSRSETTDTDRVRARYKNTGFDPAALIKPGVRQRLDANAELGGSIPSPSWKPGALALVLGVALGVWSVLNQVTNLPFLGVTLVTAFGAYLFLVIQAAFWKRRVVRPGLHLALRILLPLALGLGFFVQVLLGASQASVAALGAVTLITMALINSILNAAHSRHDAVRIAARKHLAAARALFRRELREPAPALKDEWFPWVLAFGLGRDADRWFRAFSGVAAHDSFHRGAVGHAGTLGGGASGSGGWTGFGGGGGFSGGGSSASFAAAVGGMAASVSAPSSSGSSGGGSSGGGSSGGGGGGGW